MHLTFWSPGRLTWNPSVSWVVGVLCHYIQSKHLLHSSCLFFDKTWFQSILTKFHVNFWKFVLLYTGILYIIILSPNSFFCNILYHYYRKSVWYVPINVQLKCLHLHNLFYTNVCESLEEIFKIKNKLFNWPPQDDYLVHRVPCPVLLPDSWRRRRTSASFCWSRSA